jgi:hypothetical protein
MDSAGLVSWGMPSGGLGRPGGPCLTKVRDDDAAAAAVVVPTADDDAAAAAVVVPELEPPPQSG